MTPGTTPTATPAGPPAPDPDLFTALGPIGPTRRHAPRTSRIAAAVNSPGRKSQLARVMAFVADAGTQGATAEEISEALAMRMSSTSARCSELLDAGFLIASKNRRETSSGATARVLLAAPPADVPAVKPAGEAEK